MCTRDLRRDVATVTEVSANINLSRDTRGHIPARTQLRTLPHSQTRHSSQAASAAASRGIRDIVISVAGAEGRRDSLPLLLRVGGFDLV
jgi:hypothetical protein